MLATMYMPPKDRKDFANRLIADLQPQILLMAKKFSVPEAGQGRFSRGVTYSNLL